LTRLADSTAFKDPDRILSQHQAAVTLLQARLSSPSTPHLSWLDLACGRGQIIVSLNENLSAEARAKIDYWAYDVDQNSALETQKTAQQLGFRSLQTKVGDLADFNEVLPPETLFDFITLTNTVHEIEPVHLSSLFVKCILRLADTGTFFIYDMERIHPPELGAVPWSRDDVARLLRPLLDGLGATDYHPEVGRWNHKTCKGWNVQLQRQDLGVSYADAIANAEAAIHATRTLVFELLQRRLSECRAALENLTKYGAETAEEEEDKARLLFEFWALSRCGDQ
jgi:SAM-dependent methyltransferase